MSATFPNIEEFGDWLSDANVYHTEHRPKPLDKFVVRGTNGDRWQMSREQEHEGRVLKVTKRNIYTNHHPVSNDPDGITELCLECIRRGGQVSPDKDGIHDSQYMLPANFIFEFHLFTCGCIDCITTQVKMI